MLKALTNIEVKNSDKLHDVGQILTYNLSKAFGHSFKVITYHGFREGTVEKKTPTLIKILAVAFTFFFPVSLLFNGVGILLLSCSKSHKNEYDNIKRNHEPKHAQKNNQGTTQTEQTSFAQKKELTFFPTNTTPVNTEEGITLSHTPKSEENTPSDPPHQDNLPDSRSNEETLFPSILKTQDTLPQTLSQDINHLVKKTAVHAEQLFTLKEKLIDIEQRSTQMEQQSTQQMEQQSTQHSNPANDIVSPTIARIFESNEVKNPQPTQTDALPLTEVNTVQNVTNYNSYTDEQWSNLKTNEISSFFREINEQDLYNLAEKIVSQVFTIDLQSIFSPVKNKSTFNSLPFAQLKLICKHFKPEHWEGLSAEQIKEFDFAQIAKEDLEDVTKNFVEQVFFASTFELRKENFFVKLPFEKLKFLCKHFKTQHWQKLTEQQIEDFDFTQIAKEDLGEVAKNFVEQVFFASTYDIRKETFFVKLPFEKLKFLCKHFKTQHWQKLTEQQIKEFDFTQVAEENLEAVTKKFVEDVFFASKYEVRKETFFIKLPFEKLKFLCKHFKTQHWQKLTEQQIKEFDFTQVAEENLEDVTKKFVEDVFFASSYEVRKEKTFAELSFEKLKFLCKHFKTQHWQKLTEQQIKEFDFTQIAKENLEDVTKKFVEDVFFASRYEVRKEKTFAELPFEKLKFLCKSFKPEHWKKLAEKQIKQFDFSQINPEDKDLFAEEIVKNVFDENNSYSFFQRAKLLNDLSDTTLHQLKKFFSNKHFEALNKDIKLRIQNN